MLKGTLYEFQAYKGELQWFQFGDLLFTALRLITRVE
jgi:hypothetical protein